MLAISASCSSFPGAAAAGSGSRNRTTKNRLRYFRAFDFNAGPAKSALLLKMIADNSSNDIALNKLVLHAVSEKFRGGGLAKYLWSVACKDLFGRGHQELTSSVSAANLPVVNLYASLGFRFRNSLDVYHRLVV